MILNRLDSFSLRLVKTVGKISSVHQVRSYLIGGSVRDLILRRKVLDLDFAVEKDALAVAKDFAKKFKGRVVVYHQFLTATVILQDEERIDFSVLRKEEYPHPGALPVVRQGGLKDDLFRRDFSINAMAVCVNPDRFGEIVDEFGGRKDISKRKVRVLHDGSFIDDPTRMLRGVRFEQRLDFQFDPYTQNLLKRALKVNALASVKSQRLFEEFKKNLKEPDAVRNLIRLSKLGLLKKTGWGMALTAGQVTVLKRLEQISRQVAKYRVSDAAMDVWLIRLMVLLEGLSPVKVKKAMGDWGMSNGERTKVLSAFALLDILNGKTWKSYSREEIFHLLRVKSFEELLFVWAHQSHTGIRSLIINALTKWRQASLKISGEDLRRTGIPAGKIYKALLEKVLYRAALGQCQSKQEQLAYVRKLYFMSGQ